MRYFLAALTLAFAMTASLSAYAEHRIFIVANNPDGYGVDRCLATGASCGVAVAAMRTCDRPMLSAARL